MKEDKRLHLIWSFWITIVARIIWPTPWAFMIVFIIGFLKECWDHRYGSGFCIYDIFANVIGSTFALILTSGLPGTFFEP